jgi:hypothetical protein
MLGSIAGSGLLPFKRETYEAVIQHGGKGVDASLRGFAAAFEQVNRQKDQAALVAGLLLNEELPAHISTGLEPDLAAKFPSPVHHMLGLGHARMLDYQGQAYADLYVSRLSQVLAAEQQADPAANQGYATTIEMAAVPADAMISRTGNGTWTDGVATTGRSGRPGASRGAGGHGEGHQPLRPGPVGAESAAEHPAPFPLGVRGGLRTAPDLAAASPARVAAGRDRWPAAPCRREEAMSVPTLTIDALPVAMPAGSSLPGPFNGQEPPAAGRKP